MTPFSQPFPCPFCGKEDNRTVEIDTGLYSVTCSHCGAVGPGAPTDAEAIIAWNSAELEENRGCAQRTEHATEVPLNADAGWPFPRR